MRNRRRIFALLLCSFALNPSQLAAQPAVQPPTTPGANATAATPNLQTISNNHVLQLDGRGSYVQLPPDIFNHLTEATVEGWVKWGRFRQYSRFFDFGTEWRSFLVCNVATSDGLHFAVGYPPYTPASEVSINVPGALRLGQWCHIAVTTGPRGMQVFRNGILVGSRPETGSFAMVNNGDRNYLGRSNWAADDYFEGAMDEVRVWSVQRTAEQIREAMLRRLSGQEEGLVALWNFDDGTARDATGQGHDGVLHANALITEGQPALSGSAALLTQEAVSPVNLNRTGSSQVLQLDGDGSYVELPPNIFNHLTNATIEGWVKWESLRQYSRFFDFGAAWKAIEVANEAATATLYFSLGRPPWNYDSEVRLRRPGLIRTNEWCHIALTTGSEGVRLYFNGALVGADEFTGSFASINNGDHNFLGRSNWRGQEGAVDQDFHGQMDEVRVWSVQRSAEQIRETMNQNLTGQEAGLFGLWNFEDGTARDATGHGHDGIMQGNAFIVEARFAAPEVKPVTSSNTIDAMVNGVLQLDGEDSYVELPATAFANLTSATVEGWVKWGAFRNMSRFFELGETNQSLNVQNRARTPNLHYEITLGLGATNPPPVVAANALVVNEWCHVAAVSGPGGMRLYLNGDLVGSNTFTGSFAATARAENAFLGRSVWKQLYPSDEDFRGQMDEVRVWNGVRTPEQIAATMYSTLTGREPGLVGYWNFDDPLEPLRDLSPSAQHGRFFGQAQVIPAARPASQESTVSVLALPGQGATVELPAGILNGLQELTIEAWVRWDEVGPWQGFIDFRDARPGRDHKLTFFTSDVARQLRFGIDDINNGTFVSGQQINVSDVLVAGRWIHVAGVITPEGASLYTDGKLAGTNPNLTLARLASNQINHLGYYGFVGQMDEVRLWKVGRTGEQIRADMFKSLTGQEAGLHALWNFEEITNGVVKDLGPGGFDGKAINGARRVHSNRPTIPRAEISGVVLNAAGRSLPGVPIVFTGEDGATQQTVTDATGRYQFTGLKPDQTFQLSGKHLWETVIQTNLKLQPAERRTLNLQLAPMLFISGRVQTDAGVPMAGCLLQLLATDHSATGQVVAVSLSQSDGSYHFRRLSPGTYQLRAQAAEGFKWFQERKVFEVAAGIQLTNLDFTLAPARIESSSATNAIGNRVLVTATDGGQGYVELPADIFNNLDAATVEGWVRWDRLEQNRSFYSYGIQQSGLRIRNPGGTEDLWAGMHNAGSLKASRMLNSNQWCHVAWVTGPGGMRLYFNGVLVAYNDDPASFSSLDSGAFHFLGADVYGGRFGGSRLDGAMDEVRVWSTQRTSEQIRTNMFRRLRGDELGLAALWNFDDPNDPGRDASPHGFHGQLRAGAAALAGALPSEEGFRSPVAVMGITTDKDGRALGNVTVKLVAQTAEGESDLATAETDYSGHFTILKRAAELPADAGWRLILSAKNRGDLSYPATELPQIGGENLKLELRDRANLSGHVMARDDSPLPAVVVQAVPKAKESETGEAQPGLSVQSPPVSSTLTDARGRFRFIDLPPGEYTVRAQIPGGFAAPDSPGPVTIVKDEAVTGVDFHLSPFKKGRWQHWTHAEGLPDDSVRNLFQDSSGAMWFATGGGVTRFDGRDFHSWTARDGLPNSYVECVTEGEPGVMWFGTRKGLVRYNRRDAVMPFTILTTTNGLPSDSVTTLERDARGNLWVGTSGGLARLNGTNFVNVSAPQVPDAGPGGFAGGLMGDAKLVESWRPSGPPQAPAADARTVNSVAVLDLDGNDSYVELPPNLFTNEVVTVEGWMKWRMLGSFSRFFEFSDAALQIAICNKSTNPTLQLNRFQKLGFEDLKENEAPGVLSTGQWIHVATSAGTNFSKLYVNGALVSTNEKATSWRPVTNPPPRNLLGRSVMKGVANASADTDLNGQMTEVRLWAGERTAEEIAANQFNQLTGTEPGLLALWNFADGTARDATGQGHDGKLLGNARVVSAELPVSTTVVSGNGVLSLDGNGSYVELPPNIFRNLSNATVEGWVKWNRFGVRSRFFDFGKANQTILLSADLEGDLRYYHHRTLSDFDYIHIPQILQPGQWLHLAAVSGSKGMNLYLNGMLVGDNAATSSFSSIGNNDHNFLGHSVWNESADLFGEMDEVRVWSVERTEAQIREGMSKRLTGLEEGLVGLWNFDDPANPGRDATTNRYDGKLMGNARVLRANTALPVEVGSGRQVLQLLGGAEDYLETQISLDGPFTIECWANLDGPVNNADALLGRPGHYDLNFHDGRLRVFESGRGDHVTANSATTPGVWTHYAVSRDPAGRLRIYLNGELDATSQAAVPGRIDGLDVGRSVTGRDTRGRIAEFRLWNFERSREDIRDSMDLPLTGQEEGLVGLWNFNGVSNGVVKDLAGGGQDGRLMGNTKIVSGQGPARASMQVSTVLQTYSNEDFLRVSPKALEGVETATIEAWARWNGSLPQNSSEVFLRLCRPLWESGSYINVNQGMGSGWKSLHAWVNKAGERFNLGFNPDFARWHHVALTMGTAGVKLYCDGELVASKEGLSFSPAELGPMASLEFGRLNDVNASPAEQLARDRAATMDEIRIWNRERTQDEIREAMYQNLTGQEDGLAALWNFEQPVGLKGQFVHALHCDANGVLWVGTEAGVGRLDGTNWLNYTTADGLAKGNIIAIGEARDGSMWFGTTNGVTHLTFEVPPSTGLAPQPLEDETTRPDAESASPNPRPTLIFTTFTMDQGLPHNRVTGIEEDAAGNL